MDLIIDEKKLTTLLHPDLLASLEVAYEPSGLILQNLIKEVESKEYGAYVFEMNHRRIKFRVGKITPTKSGQFVTLWKREGHGQIAPYDLTEAFDFVVVSVRKGDRFGQFVFPKMVLFEHGILSKDGKGGKRAIRIYPPWDITHSRQAKKTQTWQLLYFFDIYPTEWIDTKKIQKLFQ